MQKAMQQPSSLDPALDVLAHAPSPGLDGRGLANLLGMSVLVGRWHPEALRRAFDDSVIRSTPFTDAELVILHHVVVAIRIRGSAALGPIPVPADVLQQCAAAWDAVQAQAQPMYDIVSNVLRRSGYKYGHQLKHVGTGYTLPLTLAVPRTGAHVALSIDGRYNTLPGTDSEPSLSSRLWEDNLRQTDMHVVRITPQEAERCLGSAGIDTRSIDAFPTPLEAALQPRPMLKQPGLAKIMRGYTSAPSLGRLGSRAGEGGTPLARATAARDAAQSIDALLAAILVQLDCTR